MSMAAYGIPVQKGVLGRGLSSLLDVELFQHALDCVGVVSSSCSSFE